MSFHQFVRGTVCLGAAALAMPAFAQDVPTPPPAGVQPKVRRTVPRETAPTPAPVPQAAPMDEPLPQIPENPIKLEKDFVPPGKTAEPGPVEPAATSPAPVAKRPVKPVGPVYAFPYDPYSFPANVTTPPGMHLPNSPYVEDLSVTGDHGRYTYYSYRRPWYTPGHRSANVTILW